jgi:hypothetical protein
MKASNWCLAVWPDRIFLMFTFKNDWRIEMKSFTVVLFVLALSFVSLTGATRADLVTNGDFETGALTPWVTDNTDSGITPYGTPHGYVVAMRNSSWNGTPDLYQALPVTMSVGDVFTVSYQAKNDDSLSSTINLWGGLRYVTTGGGTVIMSPDSGNALNTLAHDWTTYNYTYTALAGQECLAQPLRFEFMMGAGTDSGKWAVMDNVSVTYTPAPEPGALALLVTGLLGLLAYAWRKRR